MASLLVKGSDDMPISVLYIHHAGPFGGSSKSLLEMVKAFPQDAVVAHVVTPYGTAADAFERAGLAVLRTRGIPGVFHAHIGYYCRLRWFLLLRELYYTPFALGTLLRARGKWTDIQLVHLNDASILAICLARLVYRVPLIVHVRHTIETAKGKMRRRLLRAVLHRYADAVIAIDESVRRTLPDGVKAHVIHNGVSLSPEAAPHEGSIRHEVDTMRQGTLVGLVGFYPAAKGVYDFIEAARICRERNLNVRFLIVGDNPREVSRLSRWILEKVGVVQRMPIRGEIENLIRAYGLADWVQLTGSVGDMVAVYQSIDMLCFPSHCEAAGRPVFEAAFAKVPSIVAMTDSPGDVIVNGRTGICVRPQDPHALADAIERLAADPRERGRMGEEAFKLAVAEFTAVKCAARVLSLYENVLAELEPSR